MTETRLHLARLILDRREVMRVAARHKVPAGADDGAILHAALSELFAKSTDRAEIPLHVFAVDDIEMRSRGRPDLLFILGYSDLGANELSTAMGSSKGKLLLRCDAKKFPDLPAGTQAIFRVRACPVIRTRQLGDHERPFDKQGKARPRELDAWLASSAPENASLGAAFPDNLPYAHTARVWTGREAVYRSWLAREITRGGGADVAGDIRLVSFQRTRFYRRSKTHGRRPSERPDAVLEGTLRVADELKFGNLLRRGVGRHRAFGFGMLLLRPPSHGP